MWINLSNVQYLVEWIEARNNEWKSLLKSWNHEMCYSRFCFRHLQKRKKIIFVNYEENILAFKFKVKDTFFVAILLKKNWEHFIIIN